MDSESNQDFVGKYEYGTLKDSASQIRLLEVLQMNPPDGSLRCRLTTHNLNNHPPYHAISYTWGSQDHIEQICLDDKTFQVRKNCADALRQALRFQGSHLLYFWLDALCIDQANTEEKNAQVALMGDIFEKAGHVLICLGEHDDDGEYAVRVIRQVIGDQITVTDHSLWPMLSIAMDRHGIPPGVDFDRFLNALAAISYRPYFSRVWVLQEVYLARDATILFGTVSIPAFQLYAQLQGVIYVLEKLSKWRNLGESEQEQFPETLSTISPELIDAVSLMEGRFNKKSEQLLGYVHDDYKMSFMPKMRMEMLIQQFASLLCQDPRDTVYGALAIADWATGTPQIYPNYDRSPLSLAIEIVQNHVGARQVRTLCRNLKLSSEDLDVRRALAWRQRNRLSSVINQAAEPESGLEREHKIDDNQDGWQLTDCDCIWKEEQGSSGAEFIRIQYDHDHPRRVVEIILPPGSKPGDYIIDKLKIDHKFTDIIHMPRHDAIVLRQVEESLYALIGRATVYDGEGRSPRTDRPLFPSLQFKLTFNAEDYVLLAVTEAQLSDEETANTGICSTPFSSFAEVMFVWDGPIDISDVPPCSPSPSWGSNVDYDGDDDEEMSPESSP